MGPDAMILVFWMLSFKPTFSLSSFTFIKISLVLLCFLPWGWCHLHIWYHILIFLPSILIPACVSSSPAFLMMYSAYKLNKQGTIYSLDELLFLFGTSLLFHVQFWLLLPDLSWWRGLIECGPLEKGMANYFSILALRTPWTVWKGKMIGYWKRNSPGQ